MKRSPRRLAAVLTAITRWHGRAAAGLVVPLALILFLAGCTGSSGRPPAAGSPPATGAGVGSPTPAASVCTRAQITAAIGDFFAAWNHRDAAALGRLFTADGVLDMATKHQDTLHESEYTSTGGLGARRLIGAFAERQWRLGEKLSYRHITAAARATASWPEGDGGFATVVARFADGTVQPMAETKFVYDCASHAFAHVVMTSAKAAGPA